METQECHHEVNLEQMESGSTVGRTDDDNQTPDYEGLRALEKTEKPPSYEGDSVPPNYSPIVSLIRTLTGSNSESQDPFYKLAKLKGSMMVYSGLSMMFALSLLFVVPKVTEHLMNCFLRNFSMSLLGLGVPVTLVLIVFCAKSTSKETFYTPLRFRNLIRTRCILQFFTAAVTSFTFILASLSSHEAAENAHTSPTMNTQGWILIISIPIIDYIAIFCLNTNNKILVEVNDALSIINP